MRQFLLSGAALAALIPSGQLWAQDRIDDHGDDPQIVVTSSRSSVPQPIDAIPLSIDLANREELELRQVRDIAELLRDVPGVAVSSVAGQTQVRLRGSEANHVLVLVDGIEVSDPFAGEFDIGTLQAEIGASVEVLRGPQAALYGSDAIGGLIAYRSATGRDEPGFAARLEGGTQGTLHGSARFGAFGDAWDVAFNATIVSTDGEPNARGGSRDIGRDSYTLSATGTIDLAENLAIDGALRFVRTEGDFNDQDFNPASPTFGLVVDSPDTRFENEAVYGLLRVTLYTLNQRWAHSIEGQFADIGRDSFGPFGRTFGSEGERLKGSYVTSFDFASEGLSHVVTFAADWEKESYRNTDPFGFAFTGERSTRNVGLVGEYVLNAGEFDLSAALRRDINNRFADETSFRLAAGYDLTEGTRLRASIGSGIKNPGFYELFGFVDGRFIGNEDLEPEKSTEWEVGIDQSFAGDAVRLSASYFDAELENEIFISFPAPTFVATPSNRDTVSTRKGIELSADAELSERVSFNAAYTRLDSEEDGVEEVRRPKNIASAALTWTAPEDRASATLIVRHNGEAEDLAFTDPSFIPVRVTLDDYTLVNFAARYRLNDRFELFGRVENLLDERYEQVFSFVSPGRSAVAGIRAHF